MENPVEEKNKRDSQVKLTEKTEKTKNNLKKTHISLTEVITVSRIRGNQV